MKKLLAGMLLFAACSCSTMFNNGSQTVSVVGADGEEGVRVEIRTPNGVYRSRLPATVVTAPSTFNSTEIKVTDKCYEDTLVEINQTIDPSFYANVFNYGVGFFIDPLTGAMWKLNHHTVVPLTKRENCRR